MGGSRRDRLRAGAQREIREAARRLLAREGLPAVTMRAVAAEVGMTSPALYRYYDGHEELLTAVCVDLFDELVAQLRTAGAHGGPGERMAATCWAFRAWALEHPLEFGLVFANPIPPVCQEAEGPLEQAGMQLAATFAALFDPLWQAYRFPVPEDDELDPVLRAELEQHAHLVPTLPLGAVFVFVACWARLVGAVSAEVFGQLHWAVEHTEPFFEDVLADVARRMTVPVDVMRRPT